MPRLHDAGVRSALHTRLQTLTPDAQRRWGKMTVDQMLWHVNEALEMAIGEKPAPPLKAPLPRSVMRFMVLNLPWPKSAPTHPAMEAGSTRFDFTKEKARCQQLIDRFASVSMDGQWVPHPFVGPMTGDQASRLQAKHLDHHFKQFSA